MAHFIAIFCVLLAPVPVKAGASSLPTIYSRVETQLSSAWDLFLKYANDGRVIRAYHKRLQIQNLQTQANYLRIEMKIDSLRYRALHNGFRFESYRCAGKAFVVQRGLMMKSGSAMKGSSPVYSPIRCAALGTVVQVATVVQSPPERVRFATPTGSGSRRQARNPKDAR